MSISRLCLEARRQFAINLEAAGLRKTDSLEVKVRTLPCERSQRIGYGKELLAAVSDCR